MDTRFKTQWIVLAAVLGSTILSPSALYTSASDTIWQIGRHDGEGLALNGALEYPATGGFWPEFEYVVGSDADPISAPSCPGCLYSANVCSVSPGRPCTDTTQRLLITFNVARAYSAGELWISYGRYGAEPDSIFLDNTGLGTASSGENVFVLLNYWLPAIDVGSHTLKIQYLPSASGNGHYIDFIALRSDAPIAVERSTWGRLKSRYRNND